MQAFNSISSAIFDVLMAPFGHDRAAFDMLLWPSLMGVLAILVYKAVSNQEALARVKGQITMRLLEIRLFSHDIVQVLKSTAAILAKKGNLSWSRKGKGNVNLIQRSVFPEYDHQA